MVQVAKSEGKKGENFARLFGNEQMGRLLSKVQSSVIRGGFELEELLNELVDGEKHTTLEQIADETIPASEKPPIQVVFKPSRPDPENEDKSIQADLLIVDHRARRFTLVEVKDGYVFDTKKSDGELASLRLITSWLAQEFAYKTQYFICAFNQDDKEEIVRGTKKRFTIEHVMTGRELCNLIGVDYDQINERRREDQAANRNYFFRELLTIPEIREEIITLLDESSTP